MKRPLTGRGKYVATGKARDSRICIKILTGNEDQKLLIYAAKLFEIVI